MYLVTADEMRRFEAAADAGGLTYHEMMQRAGAAVAEEVVSCLDGGRAVVLVGPGNNGGDGLVAAALLHDNGIHTEAFCWKRKLKGDPLVEELAQRNVTVGAVTADSDVPAVRAAMALADVVLDGLLGTGASRPLEGIPAAILDALRDVEAETGVLVAAIDVPSGMNVDTGEVDPHTVAADITVTFGFPKIGQFLFPGADCLGELVVDSLGIPEFADKAEVRLTTDLDVAALLPPRPRNSHKGTFGRALVIAGSTNYTGAAYLAGAAAYRSGCGLVTLALPGSIHSAVAGLLPEATHLQLSEDLGVIARPAADLVTERWSDYDAVLLGPGLTTERATREFLEALLSQDTAHPHHEQPSIGFSRKYHPDAPVSGSPNNGSGPPPTLVVDADGLNLLAEIEDGLTLLPAGTILTPHPGEMARLTGRTSSTINSDRIGAAKRAAADWGHIVVLKGAFTVVASPDENITVIPFAEPGLATAGTGDVLSGLIVGLLAQGMEPYAAAVAGAHIHGSAGAIAADDMGSRATMAGDVLESLVEALMDLEMLEDFA